MLANDSSSSGGLRVSSFDYRGPGGALLTALAGATVTTAAGGELTVDADGTWTYQPPAAADHSAADSLEEGFSYSVTDNAGLVASAQQSIVLGDTAPSAASDLDTVRGPSGTATSGNVLTGVDADASPGALLSADATGQDAPAAVSSVRFGNSSASFDNPADVRLDAQGQRYIEIAGEHGTLQIHEDGSYTYTITDAYDASANIETRSVGGGNGTASTWNGVTLRAYDFGTAYVDGDGHFDPLAADTRAAFTSRGVGIVGTQSGMPVPNQINHDAVTGESQALAMDFGAQVAEARVTVSNLYRGEEDGEVGHWQAFDGNRVLVGEGILDTGTIRYSDNNVGVATISVHDGDGEPIPFQFLVFDALPYADAADNPLTDSSDFLIRAVTFDALAPKDFTDLFEYTIRDADGDSSSASLGIQGEIPVPEPVSNILDSLGDSLLAGSDGADVFKWTLAESGAHDSVEHFDTAPPSDSGDVLDLHDLLPPESVGNLSSYLHFEDAGNGGTLLKISSEGAFTGDAAHDAGVNFQSIELLNVDLLSLGSDQQIIDNLVSNHKLIID